MAVSINWGSVLWCPSNESSTILESILGPLILGNSPILLAAVGLHLEYRSEKITYSCKLTLLTARHVERPSKSA